MHILSVLGGEIYQRDGEWKYGIERLYAKDIDECADYLRIYAAAELVGVAPSKQFTILLQGGRASNGRPSISSIMEKKLLRLIHRKDQKIFKEEKSATTLDQLMVLQEYVGKCKSITLITNIWHVARVKAFIQYDKGLLPLLMSIPFIIPAEWVVSMSGRRDLVEQFNYLPGMSDMIESEMRGAGLIKSGEYGNKTTGVWK